MIVIFQCMHMEFRKMVTMTQYARQQKRHRYKNWCLLTVMLEKTLESPLDCKEIQPINPKGNQPWIVIGRTDAKAETPILWPSDVKNWLTGKDPDSGEDWRQEKKGTTKDEMVGWHHQLDGHEFEQGGQGSWWCTGKPGMLQSMGLQRVRHDIVTKQQQPPLCIFLRRS